ncbi:Hypothetical predicted protein [Paramuricea clavata]|uniref:Uncharacterized protein n=1 Tax=Paramuricea clavata TaxID=317549 RepID=A0A6S7K932_PARCT|nr:Hypothetical predicted protein [Paramuricea clavata]
MADCASTSKDEAAEFELIFSPDDTDLVTDTSKLSLTVETNTSFTNKDLISVLNRVSLSKIKPEAEFAAKIVANTLEKEYFKPLSCFVSSLTDAFRQCCDRANKVKSDNLRAIKLEKEFSALRYDKTSALYISWKQLVADKCGTNACQVEAEAKIVYQHILQYFWSFVALKFSATDASSDITGIGIQMKTDCVDEAEKQAIRHHAGWAVKRARDGILPSSVPFSIKRSKDDSTSTTVSKECLLNLLKRMGTDHRQDSGKFLFIINDALLDFFIVLHKEMENFSNLILIKIQ